MSYQVSKEASKDLENIWVYTFKNWSKEQADFYIGLLFDEIELVAENPSLGQRYDQVRKGYFRARVKSHFIFYKLDSKTNQVKIIRILHQRMDIDNHLSD